MAKLALSLLGRPLIERDGVAIEINRRKTVALITYLAVTGKSHHRDKLAALFWPLFPKDRARAALRKTLMEARRAIGHEWIETEGDMVGLRFKDGLWLDVQQFNVLLDRLEENPSARDRDALPQLKQVVDLYRSDFLSEFLLNSNSTFSEWQYFQREGLRKRVVVTLDRLVEAHVKAGEHGLAIDYARRRLGLDPIDEIAHRRLIRLYAATGQYPLAIRQYRECCRRLEREIGVTPDAKTEQLYRDVIARRAVAPEEPQEAAADRPSHGARGIRSAATTGGAFRAFLRSRAGIAALCAVALVVLGAGAYAGITAVASARFRTIAVFPLADHSGEKAPESFMAGMTDALVTELAKIPRFVVRAGATAVLDNQAGAAALRDAAMAMEVSFYIYGSVTRAERTVRVSLQLVDTRHGDVLWGDSYYGSLEDPLAVQKSAAVESVRHIAMRLGLE